VLAWAVTGVSDIVLVSDEQIAPAATTIPMPAKYVTGIYAPSPGEQRYLVLNVELVLADLLSGLEEREQSNG